MVQIANFSYSKIIMMMISVTVIDASIGLYDYECPYWDQLLYFMALEI